MAACLLVGGPSAAMAIADPGGGHSGRSDNNRRDSGGSRTGSDYSDTINGGGTTGPNTDGRPSSRVGSGRESGTAEERPSSDFSPSPGGQTRSPKVTVGDGRTPGVQDHEPEPRWRWSAPEPAPPPPPQVVVVPLNPPTITPVRDEPGVVQQLVVAPASGLGDPLWGVAGLLLIPAAGAILGYRQARAAHAVAELGRHP